MALVRDGSEIGQLRGRAVIGELVELWNSTAMDAHRASWNTHASNVTMKNRLGESINLTGFNHFVRINSLRKRGQRFLLPERRQNYG